MCSCLVFVHSVIESSASTYYNKAFVDDLSWPAPGYLYRNDNNFYSQSSPSFFNYPMSRPYYAYSGYGRPAPSQAAQFASAFDQIPINLAYYTQPYTPQYIRNQRRSRTAPARVAPTTQFSHRSSVPDPTFRVRSYTGPYKNPRPMFYKTRTQPAQRIIIRDGTLPLPPPPPPPQPPQLLQPYPYPYYTYRYPSYTAGHSYHPTVGGPPPAESFYGTTTRQPPQRDRGSYFATYPQPQHQQATWRSKRQTAPTYNTGAPDGHHGRHQLAVYAMDGAARGRTPPPTSSVYGGGGESMRRSVYAEQRYPVVWRYVLKIAQILLAISVLIATTAPTWPTGFARYVQLHEVQVQIAIVVITTACLLFSVVGALSAYSARIYQVWRNVDAGTTAFCVVLSLVNGIIEAWCAACYPPYGRLHPVACRLWEWIVAAILIFAMMLLYLIDFLLALRSGVRVL